MASDLVGISSVLRDETQVSAGGIKVAFRLSSAPSDTWKETFSEVATQHAGSFHFGVYRDTQFRYSWSKSSTEWVPRGKLVVRAPNGFDLPSVMQTVKELVRITNEISGPRAAASRKAAEQLRIQQSRAELERDRQIRAAAQQAGLHSSSSAGCSLILMSILGLAILLLAAPWFV